MAGGAFWKPEDIVSSGGSNDSDVWRVLPFEWLLWLWFAIATVAAARRVARGGVRCNLMGLEVAVGLLLLHNSVSDSKCTAVVELLACSAFSEIYFIWFHGFNALVGWLFILLRIFFDTAPSFEAVETHRYLKNRLGIVRARGGGLFDHPFN